MIDHLTPHILPSLSIAVLTLSLTTMTVITYTLLSLDLLWIFAVLSIVLILSCYRYSSCPALL